MVKLVVYFKRRADMEVGPFQEYWRTRHAEVVSGLPGIRRYVQSHTLLAGYRKGEPVYDGIAEVWFDDTNAIRALDGTAALRAVQEDEARFIDRSTMKTLVTDEHLVKDGELPDGCVKNIEFVHRRPDLDVEEFQRYWREVHGPSRARSRWSSATCRATAAGAATRTGASPPATGSRSRGSRARRRCANRPGRTPMPARAPSRPTSSPPEKSPSSSPGSTSSSPEHVPSQRPWIARYDALLEAGSSLKRSGGAGSHGTRSGLPYPIRITSRPPCFGRFSFRFRSGTRSAAAPTATQVLPRRSRTG